MFQALNILYPILSLNFKSPPKYFNPIKGALLVCLEDLCMSWDVMSSDLTSELTIWARLTFRLKVGFLVSWPKLQNDIVLHFQGLILVILVLEKSRLTFCPLLGNAPISLEMHLFVPCFLVSLMNL